MIRAIAGVIRGEGVASAFRRAAERLQRAERFNDPDAPLLNVAFDDVASRYGGVGVQLMARLHEERALRRVRLVRSVPRDAKVVHIEGTAGIALHEALRLLARGARVIVSVHDFSLFSVQPHVIERDAERSARGRELLAAATGMIVPSRFLLEQHRQLFDLPLADAEVIAPGTPAAPVNGGGDQIAFAGSVQRHKGAHLLPEIAAHLAPRKLHVFGGGDIEILRALRRQSNVIVHGYYRAARLPALLARHRVGRVVLPSIVPESFSLTLSEAWLSGANVIAFDHGAIAERIREHGGGLLAPLHDMRALLDCIDAWQPSPVPRIVPTPRDAALAHVAAYQRWMRQS